MARGVNKVILIGNLGADPEIRSTTTGNAIANLRVATSIGWKDKDTQENKEITEWHRVIFFNRLAEIARDYLRKGSKIYVEGRIQTRKWQDQSGGERYTTEIIGNDLQMLDTRGAGAGSMQDANDMNFEGSYSGPEMYQNNSRGRSSQINPGHTPANTKEATSFEEDFDDDIPF